MKKEGDKIKNLSIPILLIIFNRLDTAKSVFEEIRMIKPLKLYIAGDGARENKSGEIEKVMEVREYILSNIDWECDVKTLFRKKNYGCGPNVKLSIDWFFKYETMGIILEDDTIPTKSFFYYCKDLLFKYENDDRVGMISGVNHIGSETFNSSYTFSKYKSCWGWATWKRSWLNMDFEMSWLKTENRNDIIKNMGYSKKSEPHWKNTLTLIENKKVSAWDWQWYFSLAAQNQLCIFPKTNLISNIGFGEDATHTFGEAPRHYLKTFELEFPLKGPKYILENSEFDKSFEKKQIFENPFSFKRCIPKPIKKFLKRIINGRKLK